MSQTHRILAAIAAFSCLLLIGGCGIVAAVGETHTHDAVSTSHHSRSPQNAVRLSPGVGGCGEACYEIGESLIAFHPSLLGSNLMAIGPFLPIIPIPGKGTDHSDKDLFILVYVELGTNSLVMFRLGDIHVRAEGSDENIVPNLISRCDDTDPGLDDVQIYGESQCFKLTYPIARGELGQFTLVPPVIEADRVTYSIPDLVWSPETYRWVL